MIKVPLSEKTRSSAMMAFQDMETQKLLEILDTNKNSVPDFYQKEIASAVARDQRDAKEWMVPDSREMLDSKRNQSRTNGPSESSQLQAALKSLSSLHTGVGGYGRVGSERISNDKNHATQTVGSAHSMGDTLRVKQPNISTPARKTETLLNALKQSPGESSGGESDTGGAGSYGF